MEISTARSGQSANEIRRHFATFLSSLPGAPDRDARPQSPVKNQNGSEQGLELSRIRQILNKKKELAELGATSQSTTIVISRQVQHFQEQIQATQHEVRRLVEENSRLAGQLDQISAQGANFRQENARLRAEYDAEIRELKNKVTLRDEEANTLKIKLARLQLDGESPKGVPANEAPGNLTDIVERLKSEVGQYKLEVDRLRTDKPNQPDPVLINELHLQKIEIDKQKRQLSYLQTELSNKAALLDQRQIDVEKAKGAVSSFEKMVESLKLERQTLLNETAKLREAHKGEVISLREELQGSVEFGKGQAERNNALKEQLRIAQEESIRWKNESKDLAEKLSAEKTLSARAASDLAMKSKELEYANQTLDVTNDELRALKIKLEAADKEKVKQSLGSVDAEGKWREEKSALETRVRELHSQNEKLKQEVLRLEEAVSSTALAAEPTLLQDVPLGQVTEVTEIYVNASGSGQHGSPVHRIASMVSPDSMSPPGFTPEVRQALEELEAENNLLSKKVATLEESNDELINKLSEYQTTIDRVDKERQEAMGRAEAVEESSKQKIQEFINAYNQTNPGMIKDLNMEYFNNICNENQELKTYLEYTEAQFKKMEEDYEACEAERATLEEEVRNMKEYIESLENLNEAREAKQEADGNQQEQLEQLANLAEESQRAVESRDKELSRLRHEIKTWEAELKANQERVTELLGENSRLMAQNRTLESQLTEKMESMRRAEEKMNLMNSKLSQQAEEKLEISAADKLRQEVELLRSKVQETAAAAQLQSSLAYSSHQETLVALKADYDKQVSQLNHELIKAKELAQERETAIGKLRESLHVTEESRNMMASQLHADGDRRKALEQELADLRSQLTHVAQLHDEIDKRGRTIHEKEVELEVLRTTHSAVSAKFSQQTAVFQKAEAHLGHYAIEVSKLVTALSSPETASEITQALKPALLLAAADPEKEIRNVFASIEHLLAETLRQCETLEMELGTKLEENQHLAQEIKKLETSTKLLDEQVQKATARSAEKVPSGELRVSDMVAQSFHSADAQSLREELAIKDSQIEELNDRLVQLSAKFKETSDEYFEKLRQIMEPLKESPDFGSEIAKIEQLFEEIVNTYDNEVSQDEFKYVMTTLKLAIDEFIQRVNQAFEEKLGEAGKGEANEEILAQAQELAENNQELEKAVQERDEKIQSLEDDLENLIGACEDLKTENDHLRTDKTRLENFAASKKPQKIQEIEAQYNQEIDHLRQEIRDLGNKARAIEREKVKLEQQLQEKDEELEQINQQVQKVFDEAKEEYEDKIERLQAEVDELTAERDGEAPPKDRPRNGPSHREILEENEQLQQFVQELNEHKEVLEEQIGERDARILELETLVEQLKGRTARPKEELTKGMVGRKR